MATSTADETPIGPALEDAQAIASRDNPKPPRTDDAASTTEETDFTTNLIQLIDLEHWDDGNIPRPSMTEPARGCSSEHDNKNTSTVIKSSEKHTFSPFDNVASAWQSMSRGTLTAAKNVQSQAPKTFRDIANGATKALTTAQSEMSKDLGTGLTAVRGFVDGISVPGPLRRTGEDLADLTKLTLRKSDICSNCASLPLKLPFEDSLGTEPLPLWTTPLARVLLHRRWCRVCQFFLSMLCRPENDPLRSGEVQRHIEPEKLRGLKF